MHSYGGVIEREAVAAGADWFVNDWVDLEKSLERFQVAKLAINISTLNADQPFVDVAVEDLQASSLDRSEHSVHCFLHCSSPLRPAACSTCCLLTANAQRVCAADAHLPVLFLLPCCPKVDMMRSAALRSLNLRSPQ